MRSTVALLGRLAMATADIAEGAAESAVGVANATVGRQVGAAQAVAAGLCRTTVLTGLSLAATAIDAGPALSEARHAADQAGEAALSGVDLVAGQAGQAAQALTGLGPCRTQRRVWHQGGRAAIEVHGLSGGGARHRHVAEGVRTALRSLRGVRWAEVNAVTAQVLVAFDQGELSVPQLLDTVRDVEDAHGTGREEFSWTQPDPADQAP
jgi:cation-transporting ATPase I